MGYVKRRDPKKTLMALAIITTIVIAGYAIYTWPKPTFTVYTYDSFMFWGENRDTIDETVFGAFEAQYGVKVQIERLNTDANGIVSRLVAESSNPIADVVIGIDNILILQELAKSVLEPFDPSNIDLINNSIVNALDEDHYITPFDFGLVTLIYNTSVINSATHPDLNNMTFPNLATMADMLITENPHFSSPGLAFLLSEIAVYEKLMGEDWTTWWEDVKADIDIQEGWYEAWTKWETDSTRNILVSYGTDPAYSAFWAGGAPNTAIAPINHNGQDYAWMQVEGMGLVKNGPNPELGKAFIEYCLTPAVQSHIAINQWMFPANTDVELDPVFDYAIHPDDISLLNEFLNSTEIAINLDDWFDQYDAIMSW
ncbi:MAG: thiamine ABC transporter substrate-binding protein [Candidatus Thorarchaeota archaeon]